jgi:Z1 domain.
MSDAVTTAYSAALDGMRRTGPKPVHGLAAMFGDEPGLTDGSALLAHLSAAGPEDALRQRFHRALATWDHEGTDSPWTAGTRRNSAERRAVVTVALGVDDATSALFADLFPFAAADAPIVIADDWEEWRTAERRADRDFYWSHYQTYLLGRGWAPETVAGLDEATEQVVRRLSDPTRASAYQAKGLVVGYVQSGKTANFTGVIAKAVDAGYRLVIVLTGTTNMLRAQTQRRLDMELCGRENLELEISPHDQHAHDYQDDPAWAEGFVKHGGRPSDFDSPDIHRLTNHTWDYRRLKQGFTALQFERRERNRPLYDPVNLYTSNARLVVAKKNSPVLKSLVADLGRIKDRLGEVPVLIIDDESDQASINTTSSKKWKEDSKKRSAINSLIGQLLGMMPRAQYVGYTATPYANVFIDPSDVEDIFPRDFIISLPSPPRYMGPKAFHDLDDGLPSDESSTLMSGERAHVRFLSDEPENEELRNALDMFLLTAAVKLYRQRHGAPPFTHHTMLVHEAMSKDVHRDTAEVITTLWNRGGYHTRSGLTRLRALYENDVLPTTRALDPELLAPDDFDELREDLAEALSLITPSDGRTSPVIVVNSDKELEKQQESLDFDKRRIWRILVGGNKLARGFTVEGLTVTYYRRAAKQVDTLMQMGRWFGFRRGYRDLVRLYTTEDLHSRFEAAYQDEEFLREQLRKYATPVDGKPQIRPRQVPPLIAQHRPDLKPTGRNKMWNAQIVMRSSPGDPMEPVAHPLERGLTLQNTELWLPLIRGAKRTESFRVPGSRTRHFEALVTTVSHSEMLAVLQGIAWLTPGTFQPELRWLDSLTQDQLRHWVVLLPQHKGGSSTRTLDGHPLSIFERHRDDERAFGVFSESQHRNVARRIAGVDANDGDPAVDALAAEATAAIVLYPVVRRGMLRGSAGDPVDPADVTIGFHAVTPLSTARADGRLITWTAVDSGNERAVVVDRSTSDA